ncbi:hypothetical protein HX052_08635 [Myroides marinus]|uniref:hypothetical protein n=1 Tax=Myroides marinus TaxID=703342 RepID=UPI002575676B|nr:hypothetical protein [Myroides marinus]MDM1371180.1 hypothetical protein [Myroides marinus]MDM1390032.1 hypothetical protein [Myroides marinus]
MKRILLPVSLLLSGYLAYAQVGIGTKAPHISAVLDLKADDRGLLVPQVQLKSLSDGSIVKGGVPHLGLLVFNTTSNATLRPGFYYWGSDNSGDVRGNRWIAIGDDVNASMGNKPKLSLKVENSSLVLGDKDGNIAAVPLVDLQVPTSIVADPINKGSYIYTNESRQTFRIDVVQDVITNFGDIIKNKEVVKEIVKVLKGKYGNVLFESNNFYTINPDTGVKEEIIWSDLDTTNKSFTIQKEGDIDYLVITDSKNNIVKLNVKDIATSKTFIDNLVNNNYFIDEITNKNEFINKIVHKLKGKYGNVLYEDKKFYTINPDNGVKTEIDLSDIDTTNEDFTVEKMANTDYLVIIDSRGNKVRLDVKEIALSDVFTRTLVNNNFFIAELTDKKEFINNIVNKLKGKFGNVYYDGKDFYTLDPDTGNKIRIPWSDLDTTNEKFSIVKFKDVVGRDVDYLVIKDSKGDEVSVPVADIAKSGTFVEELTENKEFIKNIVNKLKGKYGNVIYEGGKFYTVNPDTGAKTEIVWSDLDTTNAKYGIEAINGVESIVITDSKNNKVHMPVAELATNKTFVKELTENKEFIEKITNNNEFVKNIINKLKGKYGNVYYDGKDFYTLDPDTGAKTEIVWSDLDTTNAKYGIEAINGVESIVITDSKNNKVHMPVAELATNKTFVKELTENKEFIEKITNNNEFVKNIINKLKGKYGNVYYDGKDFYTLDPDTGAKTLISWSDLDTTNAKYGIEAINGVESIVITDSKNNKVHMPVAELATNKTFVKELTENKEFIEKITNNNEFVKNIINKLKGKYGNVIYEGGKFYTVDPDTGNKTEIVWSDLDTTNAKYGIEAINGVESIVITDSKNNKVHMPVAELATNKTFVKELTENKEFIEKITNNNEFVKNIINKLKGKYGNVIYEGGKFYTVDPDTGAKTLISWSDLDTTNAKYGIEAINGVESIVITDSKNNKVHMPVAELATNKTFVKELTENKEFIEKITNNNDFVKNIINKLKGKYGNVIYEGGKFYTVDPDTGAKTEIVWSDLDTTNKKFTLKTEAGVDYLVITDSKLGTVKIDVKEIAASKTFIDEITNNPNFITNIKKVQAYGSIVNQTNAENTSDVKLAKKFNSGKENEAAVLLSETLTLLAKVKENGTSDTDNFIAYNYLDETGKPAQTQITVTSDVIKSFKQIIENGDVINELNKFISKATGNVIVSKDPATNNITISYKQGDTTQTLDLTTEIQRVQNYGSITNVASDKVAKTGTGFTFNDGKAVVGSYMESVTGLARKVIKVDLADGTKGDAIEYEYTDESGNIHKISVTEDASKTFETIINQGGNKTAIENIVKKIIKTEGSKVTIEDRNGETFLIVVNGEDKKEVNLTKTFKENSYLASLVVKATGNAANVNAGFAFKDGKNAAEVLFAETLTSIEKTQEKNKPAGSNFIAYNYLDETGKPAQTQITVTSDVIKSFKQIIEDGDVINELNKFITNATGSVTVSKDPVSGNITISYKDGNTTQTLDLTKEIQRVQKYTSVSLAAAEKGVKGTGVTINPNKEGETATSYVETLTAVTRYDDKGVATPGVATAGLTYYTYKDESGDIRYVSVSQDVSNDFKTIINQGDNKTTLESIIKNLIKTEGSKVTIEDRNGEIFLIVVNGEDKKEVNLTKAFKDSSYLAKLIDQDATENTTKVKLAKKFIDGKDNSAEKLFAETLTSIEKTQEKNKPAGSNFIAYNYLDETGAPAQTQITVTSDVVDSFEQIIKEPKVINELNKFITNATGNVTVSKDPVTNNITISYKDNGNTEELHLTTEVKRVQNYGSLTSVAADKVAKTGKGLTFNNGKEAAGSFNESLTGFTTKTDKVTLEDGTQGDAITYVYKDESTNDQLLPITADIAKTFKTIVNQEGNKEYIENIVNNAVPSGFITNTAADQATKKGAGFTFNNGKEVKGSYVETVTSLERKETQTNLPDNKTGKSIKYEYKDETGKVIDITVTDDVASSFTTIINQGDNKTAIENIIKNLIKSEGSKVTVERNATTGDVTLVIVNDQNTERVNISAMIKDNAKNPWLVQGSANVAITDTENIAHTGTVAIGGNTLLSNPKATNTKLSVTGDVVIDGKFFSANSVYADYVFEKYFTGASNLNLTYEFKSLDYVKDFVEKYNHLPGVTKISDVSRSEDGKYMIDFTELSIQQLEKIEELYLHTIEQEGKIESLNKKVDEMEARLKALEQLLSK